MVCFDAQRKECSSGKGASNARLAFDLELQEPRPLDFSEENPVTIGSFEEQNFQNLFVAPDHSNDWNEKVIKRQNNPPGDVAVYSDGVPVTVEDANEEASALYEVMFVQSTSYDPFIRHEARRLYNRVGETRIRISSKPTFLYRPWQGWCGSRENCSFKRGPSVSLL